MQGSRRTFLGAGIAVPVAAAGSGPPPASQAGGTNGTQKLLLEDFQPKSTLVVPENPVARARFPVIDVHTHISSVFGRRRARNAGQPELAVDAFRQLNQIVAWMDELNIQTLTNVTGGYGNDLKQNVRDLQERYKGRILNCVVPGYDRLGEQKYPQWQAEEIRRAKESGAVGLKISKTLGLGLRENGTSGPLVRIDDRRFDPMWEAAGALHMPVFIHTADPDAFFIPIDRFNERWEELGNHPEWSFYGKEFPPKAELLAARNRVIARHGQTTFVGLHVGNHPENLDEVSAWLKQYSNFHVEIGARLGELGRQPRRARRFFDAFQDRILFGTDATPNGAHVPQQDLRPPMYQAYFRFLETLDEYFDYAPSPTPPQGRWKIYGIGLPEAMLKKVYHDNAARLLSLDLI